MGFFADASAVVFVAAISEYDQVLSEEPTINRLHDAMQTFHSIANSGWFDTVPLVLLLNKLDLYKQKVGQASLRVCFPKYRGGSGADEGLDYIKNEFLKRVRPAAGEMGGGAGGGRQVFVHVISAVEVGSAKVLLEGVKEVVRRRASEAASQAQLQ